MARLKVLPEQAIISGFKGKIDYYEYMGIPVARKWPRSPGKRRSPAVEAQWQTFQDAAPLWKQLDPEIQDYYNQLASGTGMTGRDMFTRGYISGLYRYPHDVEEEMKYYWLADTIVLFEYQYNSVTRAWTDIALGAYLPIGSAFAILEMIGATNEFGPGGDILFRLREKDATWTFYPCLSWWPEEENRGHKHLFVTIPVDADRKIQYSVENPPSHIAWQSLYLLGYIR